MLLIILLYLLLGGVAGFFAGLFGIGAGILLVPALHELFVAQGFLPDVALRSALGTSMAAIIFSAIASLRTHHRHGAVIWRVVAWISPGILVGTLLGSQLAGALPTRALALFFVLFLLLIALQMALDLRPAPARTLPGKVGLSGVGTAIGAVMSLIAGGGGTLSIPYLVWCNVDMRKAVGTAAAIGCPIAISGALGYAIAGWHAGNLPPWSIGYVYLPALLATVATSSLLAPFGANLAHRLPARAMKRAFSVLLLLVAARMIYKFLE